MKKNRYIALLRGINVGGHKKILMADLRTLLVHCGFSEVETYIQSGNVVFSSERNVGLDALISEAIKNTYGWEVPVLIKTASEMEAILSHCPFPKEKKEKSYFILLYQPPLAANIKTTLDFNFPGEEFVITPSCVYFYSSVGIGNSKMNNNFFENKLNVVATARNYRTLRKMLELST
jgi:uncharacterized protein (DUF1697 family)